MTELNMKILVFFPSGLFFFGGGVEWLGWGISLLLNYCSNLKLYKIMRKKSGPPQISKSLNEQNVLLAV